MSEHRLRCIHVAMYTLLAVALVGITTAAANAATVNDMGSCIHYSPNKFDYHDIDIMVVPNVLNETACCALCTAHNAARPKGAPSSTNCTIAVW